MFYVKKKNVGTPYKIWPVILQGVNLQDNNELVTASTALILNTSGM